MQHGSFCRAAVGVFFFFASELSFADVYLQEGFNAGGLPSGWTTSTVSGTTSTWSVVGVGTNPPIAPYAGAGQAKFNSYDASSGHQSRLTARRADFSAATDPFLTFFMYHEEEFFLAFDSMYVEATTGDSIAGPWTTITGYRRPTAVPGWKREVLSLAQYNGISRLFVSFRGVSQYGNNIFIDEIRIADSSFHDIGTLGLLSPIGTSDANAPSTANPSELLRRTSRLFVVNREENRGSIMMGLSSPLTIGAVVQNYGTFSEVTYQVRWTIDGQNQPAVNNPGTLGRNGRDTLVLSWATPTAGTHTITAWTFLGSDSNRTNDSARLAVAVLDSSVIFAEMFNGGAFPPAGWTTVNRDGGSLPAWFQGTSTSAFFGYEGVGFAANNFQSANGTYIDDYLISPAIPGIAPPGRSDSLSLWVRSVFNQPPATNYPDSLMILLSTSGADTSNFTILLDYFDVPKTGWSLKRYSLTGRVPANSTIRVACRYLHYNGGQTGTASDFIGIDFVHITRGLPTLVQSNTGPPSGFALEQNYPNPFNPSTEIRFSVGVAGKTTLRLFNLIGQTVATLFDGPATPGEVYTARVSGDQWAGGVYFYVLQSGEKTEVRKMVLIK